MAKHALEKRLKKQEERIEALSEQQEISDQSLQQLRTKMKKMENSIRELEKQLDPIKNDSWKRRRTVAHDPTLGINTMNQGDGLLHGMASMPGQPQSRHTQQLSKSESNVLLAFIQNMEYPVTLDALHMAFSAVGTVQKIIMFDKNGVVQALIQYPDVQTAVFAKKALEGHCIYDGGFCKLHIAYSHHTDLNIQVNNEWSRDYTIPNIPVVNTQPSIMGQQPVQMRSHAAAPYNGTQFAPTDQSVRMPQPSAGWRPMVSAVPQSMPIQMHNQQYMHMPPGTIPSGMGPGMMHNGAPRVTFPTYHGGSVQ